MLREDFYERLCLAERGKSQGPWSSPTSSEASGGSAFSPGAHRGVCARSSTDPFSRP